MASAARRLRRPTVSVVCPTAHPGHVVAAALGDLRDVVDEVVVAADARVGADDLGHYAHVADTLLRFEFAGRNRHWPWLAEQARGDWLLIHDGDELVGSALLDALGDLVSDPRIHQYTFPIHWPWPDNAHRVVGEPWDSGYGTRLVRNDGRLAFYAAPHGMVVADSPSRHVDTLPVYHLNLLLADRATREAKVSRYDAHQFGLLTVEGVPVNAAYYVPESAEPRPETAEIPPADAARIERIVRARPFADARDPSTVRALDRARVEWYAPRRTLPPEDYRATLVLARPLPVFAAGCDQYPVWVRVTNEGEARWPGAVGREPDIRLGAYWQTPDRRTRIEAAHAQLPHRLDPGETTIVSTGLAAPAHAGAVDLVLDLVHENVRWFECALTVRVDVQPSPQARVEALAARHGRLLPLAAVSAERRAVARPNGLLRPQGPGRPLADPRLDELTRDLPRGGWAADTPTLDRIVELVRATEPRAIVEFGSGTTTVVLAALLRELHAGEWPRLVSIEHDQPTRERTTAALKHRGLAKVAAVLHAPLSPLDDNAPRCYVLDEGAEAILRDHPADLILVDGPPLSSGASRVGTLDLVAPFLRRDAIVLLDDAFRDAELCVADAWQRRSDVTVHGICPTPVGLLEATLHPSSPPQDASRATAAAGASPSDDARRRDVVGRSSFRDRLRGRARPSRRT